MAKAKKKQTDYSKYAIIALVIVLIGVLAYAIVSMFDTTPTDERPVVASVNEEYIFQDEVDKRFKYLKAQQGNVDWEYALNYTINQRLLIQKANELEVTVDKTKIVEGIDKWITDLQVQMPPEQLALMLASQNTTLDEFRNDTIELYIENFIIFNLLNKTVFPEINQNISIVITPAEIQEYYDAHLDDYDRVDVSHILICHKDSLTCESNRTKEEARAKIEEVLGLLNGNLFEDLAQDYSEGPSAAEGGSIGYQMKGQLVPEFEKAAFALKYPNQISGIVETDFGYHIIKLNDRKTGFDAYKTEIEMQLQLEKQNQAQMDLYELQQIAISEYIEELRSSSDIRYVVANPYLTKPDATPGIQTFSVKANEVCYEDGKPVIRMFSSTSCPHCKWIAETFDEFAEENKDTVKAYHWELDTGDNTLTEFVENHMPESERDLFVNFNKGMSVPTFIFGCKYYRVGTGYERENDLISEKREFKAVIEKLIKKN